MFLDQETSLIMLYFTWIIQHFCVRAELSPTCLQDLIEEFSANHREWDVPGILTALAL